MRIIPPFIVGGESVLLLLAARGIIEAHSAFSFFLRGGSLTLLVFLAVNYSTLMDNSFKGLFLPNRGFFSF